MQEVVDAYVGIVKLSLKSDQSSSKYDFITGLSSVNAHFILNIAIHMAVGTMVNDLS
jgi:hypothetical protein